MGSVFLAVAAYFGRSRTQRNTMSNKAAFFGGPRSAPRAPPSIPWPELSSPRRVQINAGMYTTWNNFHQRQVDSNQKARKAWDKGLYLIPAIPECWQCRNYARRKCEVPPLSVSGLCAQTSVLQGTQVGPMTRSAWRSCPGLRVLRHGQPERFGHCAG
jgi:hypothetical protein